MNKKNKDLVSRSAQNKYPNESAGRLMIKNVPLASPKENILNVKNMLFQKMKELETINYIYVIDKNRKLAGVFSVKDIFRKAGEIKVKEVMETEIIKVKPHTDQERVAILALRHNLKAIPVVDKENCFLGIVPSDTILKVLHSENVEDLLRFAGIRKTNNYLPAKYFKTSVKASIKARIPWLIIGLLGGIFAAQIIGFFEHALEVKLILAAFIPLITYMAGAVSCQTATLFVRNISLDPKMSGKKFLFKEIKTGLGIALICGFLISIYSLVRFHSPYLGVVLGIALFSATIVSVIIGTFVPWLLERFKKDPALGTGPLATILQDIISIVIYFVTATLLLNFFI